MAHPGNGAGIASVFLNGIYDHYLEICNQVCNGVELLGIVLDEVTNGNDERVFYVDSSKARVVLKQTNENR